MKVENTHLSWLLNLRNLGLIAENRDLNWIRLLLFITSVSVPDLVIRVPAYLESCTEK